MRRHTHTHRGCTIVMPCILEGQLTHLLSYVRTVDVTDTLLLSHASLKDSCGLTFPHRQNYFDIIL